MAPLSLFIVNIILSLNDFETMTKSAIFKLLRLPCNNATAPFFLFTVTIILSLKDSETKPKSAILKLLELPWDCPTYPVHSHYNTEP